MKKLLLSLYRNFIVTELRKLFASILERFYLIIITHLSQDISQTDIQYDYTVGEVLAIKKYLQKVSWRNHIRDKVMSAALNDEEIEAIIKKL